jgi:hypothetical protein
LQNGELPPIQPIEQPPAEEPLQMEEQVPQPEPALAGQDDEIPPDQPTAEFGP